MQQANVEQSNERLEQISRLNDQYRKTVEYRNVLWSDGVDSLRPVKNTAWALGDTYDEAVKWFAEFTAEDDPSGEHRRGRVIYTSAWFSEPIEVVWEIYYRARNPLRKGSFPPDPLDPTIRRYITVRLSPVTR